MLTNFLFVIVGSIRGWYRRRAERQAMWMATDGLSHLSDDVLSDIGIARDEITCAFLGAEHREAVEPPMATFLVEASREAAGGDGFGQLSSSR